MVKEMITIMRKWWQRIEGNSLRAKSTIMDRRAQRLRSRRNNQMRRREFLT